nr:hypothetical protein [uncultured Mediterranean phage uvMED]BAR23022.1 hypothetical protein [uncultured Mediterranean phage uvMED]BAR23121.1 hypothetical protein [uncultured Mediterranean phage uvMED]BAR23276.1 hypothetical protein [uncultured Mediterranean phage uvMED]
MAQASNDTVDNGTGASVRSDINTRLAALFTNHSGTTDTTMVEKYAHQFWADSSSTNQLKIRNSANSAWIPLRTLDGGVIAKEGTASSPSISFGTASNTGFFRPNNSVDNEVALAVDGQAYISAGYNVGPTQDSNRCLRIGPGAALTSGFVKPNLQTASDSASKCTFVSEDGFLMVSGVGNPLIQINRLGDTASGNNLIIFRQNGTQEGSITVSPTGQVALAGAHLERWSQLPGGASRFEIPEGTVMSNTDELAEWENESNSHLNRCVISAVEGDPNVAGIFGGWDNDDDVNLNDFYIAMTGDYFIRIAQGTTVARGDLLMSAGDGTAKPQGDDIIRSKTVAKVISIHVSTTYDDGSYCVPCVLMAC